MPRDWLHRCIVSDNRIHYLVSALALSWLAAVSCYIATCNKSIGSLSRPSNYSFYMLHNITCGIEPPPHKMDPEWWATCNCIVLYRAALRLGARPSIARWLIVCTINATCMLCHEYTVHHCTCRGHQLAWSWWGPHHTWLWYCRWSTSVGRFSVTYCMASQHDSIPTWGHLVVPYWLVVSWHYMPRDAQAELQNIPGSHGLVFICVRSYVTDKSLIIANHHITWPTADCTAVRLCCTSSEGPQKLCPGKLCA